MTAINIKPLLPKAKIFEINDCDVTFLSVNLRLDSCGSLRLLFEE